VVDNQLSLVYTQPEARKEGHGDTVTTTRAHKSNSSEARSSTAMENGRQAYDFCQALAEFFVTDAKNPLRNARLMAACAQLLGTGHDTGWFDRVTDLDPEDPGAADGEA